MKSNKYFKICSNWSNKKGRSSIGWFHDAHKSNYINFLQQTLVEYIKLIAITTVGTGETK